MTATMSSAPLAQQAGEQIAKTIQRGANLAAITDIDAFSALGTGILGTDAFSGIPALQQFLATGDLAAFEETSSQAGYAALSGLNSYATGNLAGIDAFSALGATSLSDLDSLSAIPAYVALAGGDITATGDLASLSAVDTFFGDGTGTGGVFTGGGVNALAPDADGNGGYAALSALPVFFGNDPAAPFGLGVFTGGGVDALSNYDALSAVPAYLNPAPATFAAAAAAPSQNQTTFKAPAVDTQSAAKPLADVTPAVDPAPAADPVKPSNNKQGEVRNGLSFKPEGFGGIPLFGSGNGAGVDNSIRGYGDMLKKAGLNGGETSAPAGGASTP